MTARARKYMLNIKSKNYTWKRAFPIGFDFDRKEVPVLSFFDLPSIKGMGDKMYFHYDEEGNPTTITSCNEPKKYDDIEIMSPLAIMNKVHEAVFNEDMENAKERRSILVPGKVIDCTDPSNGLDILQEMLEAVRIPEEYHGRKDEANNYKASKL